MGRYTGPKGRVNRRLGALVFENAGAQKAFEKREYPPGMSQKRKKISDYGVSLKEKQKIKFYFGIREEQLRRYFSEARKGDGNTGEDLLVMCERRLDNVVRRAGFALTRPQARQGVTHRHFQVNGKTVDKPSMWLKAGDVVTVRKRPNLLVLYNELLEANSSPICNWLTVEAAELKVVVNAVPTMDDVSLPVDVGRVVAFMGR